MDLQGTFFLGKKAKSLTTITPAFSKRTYLKHSVLRLKHSVLRLFAFDSCVCPLKPQLNDQIQDFLTRQNMERKCSIVKQVSVIDIMI